MVFYRKWGSKFIESSEDGYLRFYVFHCGKLLKRIKFNKALFGVCLWNENFVFVGNEDKKIYLVNVEKGEVINSVVGNGNTVLMVKKFLNKFNEECLVVQGDDKDEIVLYKRKK